MTTGKNAASEAVVIIGAGHAGASLAGFLRQAGFDHDIVILGAEAHLPYQRPPLSKKFMTDTAHQVLRDAGFYEDMKIDLRTNTSVTAIDPEGMSVLTADGERISYGHLVIATGARPRMLQLPGSASTGTLSLRTLDDAIALRIALSCGGPLVIVGGGYVGLEVAAEAINHGVSVTVLEREQRVLARVASPQFSELVGERHRASGTNIITGASTVRFTTAKNA